MEQIVNRLERRSFGMDAFASLSEVYSKRQSFMLDLAVCSLREAKPPEILKELLIRFSLGPQ